MNWMLENNWNSLARNKYETEQQERRISIE